jgi:O-antigen/teichoic acid export membrane protein
LRARLRFLVAEYSVAGGRWLTAVFSMLAFPRFQLGDGLLIFGVALLAGEVFTLVAAAVALASQPAAATTVARRGRLRLLSAVPFASNGILSIAYNRFDVVILAGLSSAGQLALYAPASRIQDALYLLPGALASVSYPLISKAWHAGRRDDVARLTRTLMIAGLLLSLPVTICVFVFAEQILSVVLGPQYASAATATRVIIWFLPVAGVGAPLLSALAGTDNAGKTTIGFGAAFATAIALHLLLDRRYGAVGGAVASVARDVPNVLVAFVFAWLAGLLRRPATEIPPVIGLPSEART